MADPPDGRPHDRPDDRRAGYYAEKLWELIPPVHRDADDGALRAFVEVLAEQAAIVRRSTDRLWEDQFIDFCADWAVPYLGDLVGTRLVAALDRRGRRSDVANTIYYRRRAGTLAVLEGLTADITGWEGTVVEGFRRLARLPHGLDQAPAATGRISGTPAHGLPDLRRPRGAEVAWSPWDEFAHLPDMRRHHGGSDGRYGISKIAIHLYRLAAFPVFRATPRELAADADGHTRFTFDPSGRSIPLFQRRGRPDFAHGWRPALEWELPAPMRCEVLGHAEYVITEAGILTWLTARDVTPDQADALRLVRGGRFRFRDEGALRARLATLPAPALGTAAVGRILADALVDDCGTAALLPAGEGGSGSGGGSGGSGGEVWSVMVEEPGAGPGLEQVPRELIAAGNLAAGTRTPADKRLVIDAENGLGYFTAGTLPAGVAVSYAYGLSGPLGAGGYARPGLAVPAAGRFRGGGPLPAPAPVGGGGGGGDTAVSVMDSATYRLSTNVAAGRRLSLLADSEQRPYLELAGDWTITATAADAELVIDGWWLGARAPRTVTIDAAAGASWRAIRIAHTTFDPGGTDADGGVLGPVTLSIAATVTSLVVESCVLGPVTVTSTGVVRWFTVTDSVIHTTDPTTTPVALRHPDGDLEIRGVTVFGQLQAHRLAASELLCTGIMTVEDLQAGYVRFSAFPAGGQVPRAHRTVTVGDPRALFVSRRFGDPGYARLTDVTPPAIARGGENGTEIGAFHRELTPVKLDSLRAKVEEFLPFGLVPQFISET